MKNVSIETGSNYAAVKFDNIEIYFSYKTPIAFWAKGSDASPTDVVVRRNDWGPTTGKHLNAIDGGDSKSRIPGKLFETKLAEVLKSFGLSD